MHVMTLLLLLLLFTVMYLVYIYLFLYFFFVFLLYWRAWQALLLLGKGAKDAGPSTRCALLPLMAESFLTYFATTG